MAQLTRTGYYDMMLARSRVGDTSDFKLTVRECPMCGDSHGDLTARSVVVSEEKLSIVTVATVTATFRYPCRDEVDVEVKATVIA